MLFVREKEIPLQARFPVWEQGYQYFPLYFPVKTETMSLFIRTSSIYPA